MSTEDAGQIALVTGANKGIGREIALQLGRHGFTVLIGARDQERGQAAAKALASEGVTAHHVSLNVADEHSIQAAATTIAADYGRLDVLVNNAGIALDRVPPSQIALDDLRTTFDTNFFGLFAVTKAMLPLLRKARAGRIVNLSSTLGSLTRHSEPDWEYYHSKFLAYNSSKSAVNALTVHLAYELRDTPIKVNAADPGFVATDLNNHRGVRTVEQGAKAAVYLATLPPDGPTGQFMDEDGVVPW